MKLKVSEINKCLDILLKVKRQKSVAFIAENRKKINEYANKQLELKNPKIPEIIKFAKKHGLEWMFEEEYRRDKIWLYYKTWGTDYRIGLKEDQVFKDICFEIMTKEKEITIEIDDLSEQLEGIIKTTKKKDLIEQFPEIADLLNIIQPNICVSLICIDNIKQKLK